MASTMPGFFYIISPVRISCRETPFDVKFDYFINNLKITDSCINLALNYTHYQPLLKATIIKRMQ